MGKPSRRARTERHDLQDRRISPWQGRQPHPVWAATNSGQNNEQHGDEGENKNRKVELCQIAVPMIGNTLRIIHVTPKQLAKLNAIPVGKEVFLSQYYCQIGGDIWVIRT